jgi:superfamily II DNA or RNA helicase
MNPRYYQQAAHDAAWNYLGSQSGEPLIVLPTGAGKSLVIAMLVEQARKFDARVIVLQHRKELIEQNAEKIQILLPDIKVGIYSAGLKRKEIADDVVVAGIQSIYRKANELGRRELILIDEVHLVGNNNDSMYGQFLSDIRAVNPRSRMIGLTATAFRTGEGSICGPDKLFQQVCYESLTGDLIGQGFLCPITNKSADASVDMTGVKIQGGEFAQREAEKAFDISDKVFAACSEVVERCQGRKSILTFASGVGHAENITTCLQQLTGERVEVVTGETFPMERAAYLNDFKDGSLRWLVNCDVLCLDEKTEILTSSGWVGIDDMTPLHQVASWETDNSIVFEPPKTIVRRPRLPFEKMVSLKTNGVDIRVTSNHRMVYEKGLNKNKRWEVTPAENLVGRPVRLPAHGFAVPSTCEPQQESISVKKKQARIRSLSYVYRSRDGLSTQDAKREAVAFVGSRDVMEFKSPGELTDSECQLIGFWIGDGTKSMGRFSIAQSMAYPDNVSHVDRLLRLTGIAHSRKVYEPTTKTNNQSVRWTLARGTGGKQQRVKRGYYHIEPYLEKSGTSLFWGLGNYQILSMLKGLWMADGLHHAKCKRNSITSVNKQLIDLLQAICTCRGIRTSIRKLSSPTKNTHQQQWCFSWDLTAHSIKTQKNRFRLEEEPGVEDERVWCVTSVTGKIVTRRNGKVAVVGNTTGFDAPCIDAIAVLRATMSPGLFAQIVGRGLRKHESKTDCLILDFGGNIRRHGSLDMPGYGIATGNKKCRKCDKISPLAARECQECGTLFPPAGMKPCPDCDEFVKHGEMKCHHCGYEWPSKSCPNCNAVCDPEDIICEDCGFRFPEPKPRELNHDTTADEESTLTGQPEPETFIVESVACGRHNKRNAPEALPTLRVDYTCQPADSVGGNLTGQVISEWVCIEHEGYAGTKARAWWDARSEVPTPTTVDDAVKLLDRGAGRNPVTLTARREGKFWRILSFDFESEKPVAVGVADVEFDDDDWVPF